MYYQGVYKLLIVDDERLIRQGLKNVIPWQDMGFVVIGEAADGKAALELAREKRPDVMLTDIRMPDMTGLELISVLQGEFPALRSVVISGYNDFDYAHIALRLHVEDYILKPIEPMEIKRVFTRIKSSLDTAVKQKIYQRNIHYACTEFEMLRQLYDDLKSEAFSEQPHSGPHRYRLILFRRLDYRYDWNDPGQRKETHSQALLDFLEGYYCITTEGILTVLLSGGKNMDSFIEAVEAVLGSLADSYRIAVSRKALELENVIDAYLAISPLLYLPGKKSVLYLEDMLPMKSNGENLTMLRKSLIEHLEAGDDIEGIIEKILVEANKSHLNPTGAYLHILHELSRYFQIFDWRPSEALQSGIVSEGAAEIPVEDLTRTFLWDMDALRKRISNQGGSGAFVLACRAKRIIEEYYSDPSLSLSGLAERLKVSYGYLSMVFSRITGVGFSAYLMEIRMEKAREFLRRRTLKIYEAASLAGFSNVRYFSDAFKKRYGLSPAAYAKGIGRTANEK
jgi:two-component system response regulator YesN